MNTNLRGDLTLLYFFIIVITGGALLRIYSEMSRVEAFVFILSTGSSVFLMLIFIWHHFSKQGRDRRKRIQQRKEIPIVLLEKKNDSIFLGVDQDLKIPIFLPDHIRMRHVHILGATGSGKTESVILNFLRQDVSRGIGAIILDAKGDASFLTQLKLWVPEERLRVFDLGSVDSLAYNPLEAGNPHESAQRLFSSLTWSEEYYKSKAFSALQRLFQIRFEMTKRNPTLVELSSDLESAEVYSGMTASESYSKKMAERDFSDLSGLRDQIRSLSLGHLEKIISPEKSEIQLEEAQTGAVFYFRLQSLMSPQLVAVLGKLIINHLSYIAGVAHREETETRKKLIPIYLDEFASFACPEFGDLISKARSAGMALHFSHQSIGDVSEVSKGFLNRITDSSATKIVLRINDPDSADFFARSFGTKLYQKTTQRITNAKDMERAEVLGEGTQREAHQFRSPPDVFKTLPTGMGSVLIAHGEATPHGASSVFKIQFPRLSA